MRRPKVCLLTTSLLVVKFFLLPHIRALSENYDLTLVVNVDDSDFLEGLNLPIRVVHIPIKRKISLIDDLRALWLVVQFFRRERFDVVHTVAPKAGIVGIFAGWIARVPKRLHVFQGEVWTTHKGLMKFFLKSMDRAVGMIATNILVVSNSERDFLIKKRIISAKKAVVLGAGSISGVDMVRFKSDIVVNGKMRQKLGIAESDLVLLYVGRLNRDKGILDLIKAFSNLDSVRFSHVHLVIAGPDEEGILKKIPKLTKDIKQRVHIEPFTPTPEDYISMGDILILPSYREGFGVVIIEAAAAKIPAIGSRIYGITDAIKENETGLLFEAGNDKELSERMIYLLENKDIRLKLGLAAYSRCKRDFLQENIISKNLIYYEELTKGDYIV